MGQSLEDRRTSQIASEESSRLQTQPLLPPNTRSEVASSPNSKWLESLIIAEAGSHVSCLLSWRRVRGQASSRPMSTWTLHRQQSIHIDWHINHTVLHKSCQTNFLFDVRINTWWGHRCIKKKKKKNHGRPKELAAVLIRFNYRKIKQRMLSALLGANCLPEPVLWPQSESGQIWGQSSSYLASLTRARDAPSALSLNAYYCVFSAVLTSKGQDPQSQRFPRTPQRRFDLAIAGKSQISAHWGCGPRHILRGRRFYSNTCLLADQLTYRFFPSPSACFAVC